MARGARRKQLHHPSFENRKTVGSRSLRAGLRALPLHREARSEYRYFETMQVPVPTQYQIRIAAYLYAGQSKLSKGLDCRPASQAHWMSLWAMKTRAPHQRIHA